MAMVAPPWLPWRRHGSSSQRSGRGLEAAGTQAHAPRAPGHHVQPLTWPLLSSPAVVCTAGPCCSVGWSVDAMRSGPPAPTNHSRRHRSRSFPENQAKKGQTVSKRNEDALRRPPCVQKELALCRPCATPACTPGEVLREETVLAADSGPWPLSCKPPSRSQQLSSVWLESWASMLSAL